MPDERTTETPVFNPELSRLHLLVLVPLLGLPLVWRARAAADSEADRAELTAAIRCQTASAVVWLVHLLLQLAIFFVLWLAHATPGGQAMLGVTTAVVWIATGLNLLMLLLEWGVLAAAGVRASRGRPYPLSRRERRQAAAQARAEARSWKPLDAE